MMHYVKMFLYTVIALILTYSAVSAYVDNRRINCHYKSVDLYDKAAKARGLSKTKCDTYYKSTQSNETDWNDCVKDVIRDQEIDNVRIEYELKKAGC